MHQSGEDRPRHGRITKQGPAHARSMLVEAAWLAVRSPGPLRAFYERVARRRGNHIAAVAVARKLAVIIWHLLRNGEDYAWVRPALHAKKLRDLELRSGQPPQRGQRGAAYAYNLAATRREERRRANKQRLRIDDKLKAGRDEAAKCPQAPQTRSDAEAARPSFHLAPGSLPRGHPWAAREIALDHADGTGQPHPWSTGDRS